MKKKEIFWVLGTLVVTAVAWVIYAHFIEEEYVEPGAAPKIELTETEQTSVEEAPMVTEGFASVGDEEETTETESQPAETQE